MPVTSSGKVLYFAITVGAGEDSRVVSYFTSAANASRTFADLLLSVEDDTLSEQVGLVVTTHDPDNGTYLNPVSEILANL